MFRFGSPQYFYLLLLVVTLASLYVVAMAMRRSRLEKFGNLATIALLMPDVSTRRVRNKFLIYLVALTLIVVALARPQFGSKLREVKSKGIELMLAVDVSNSMLARDFEPNRLERTKFAINRLLEGLKQDRVGLIVFAGDAFTQLPITSDYVAARNFINQISTDMVSKQGTAIGAAIDLAASSFSSESEGSRAIIVISDGENHEDDAVEAAKKAAKQGIRIYTIGVGTPEGAPIPIAGTDDFIKDEQGNMVVSKIDEATLEKIALVSDGAYIRSNNTSIGLAEIVKKINETEKKQLATTAFEDYNEQYQYVLAVVLALLLLEGLIISRRNRLLDRFNIFNRKQD